MYISTLTIIAVVISGIVVLIVLDKISQVQSQLHELTKEIKAMKHNVDWKG